MSFLQELEQFIDDEEGADDELNLIIIMANKLKDAGASMEDIEAKLETQFGGEYLNEPREGEDQSIMDKVREALGA